MDIVCAIAVSVVTTLFICGVLALLMQPNRGSPTLTAEERYALLMAIDGLGDTKAGLERSKPLVGLLDRTKCGP